MFQYVATIPRLPRSTLFPYTTLFRSKAAKEDIHALQGIWNLVRLETDGKQVDPTLTWRAKVIIWNDKVTVLEETRSEEHTSELQSPCNILCRLLLEKKKSYVSTHILL